jgi:hypothetical protein
MKSKPTRPAQAKPQFPKVIPAKGVPGITATICRQERKKVDKAAVEQTYVACLVSYSKGGRRHMESHADLGEAEAAARSAVDEFAKGRQSVLELAGPAKEAYERSQEILAPLGMPLDVVAQAMSKSRHSEGMSARDNSRMGYDIGVFICWGIAYNFEDLESYSDANLSKLESRLDPESLEKLKSFWQTDEGSAKQWLLMSRLASHVASTTAACAQLLSRSVAFSVGKLTSPLHRRVSSALMAVW